MKEQITRDIVAYDGRIVLEPREYVLVETLHLPSSITLIGNGARLLGALDLSPVVRIQGKDVRIHDCNIELNTTVDRASMALHCAAGERCLVERVVCSVGTSNTNKSKHYPAWLHDMKNSTLRDVELRDSGSYGVYIHNCRNVHFQSCLARNNWGDGFKAVECRHLYFSDCSSYDNGNDTGQQGDGWDLFNGGRDCTLLNCLATRNGANGLVTKGLSPSYPPSDGHYNRGVTVVGCDFSNNVKNGVWCGDHLNAFPHIISYMMSGCRIEGNGEHGILISGGVCRLRDNIVRRNKRGITLQKFTRWCNVVGNIITHNKDWSLNIDGREHVVRDNLALGGDLELMEREDDTFGGRNDWPADPNATFGKDPTDRGMVIVDGAIFNGANVVRHHKSDNVS